MEIQSPAVVAFFKRLHKGELDIIESKFLVLILRLVNACQIFSVESYLKKLICWYLQLDFF